MTSDIARITLDERTVLRRKADIEHERAVAIFDLLEMSRFALVSGATPPFHLHLQVEENRLIFEVRPMEGEMIEKVALPLTPFRSIVKDYFLVCENYFNAIRSSSPSKIEAIDMGRRALHNEGSALLRERLAERVTIDDDTARRLFTLLCVLHIRGA
ncbi:MAG TPA: UPF0262 family protein [Stellaceae bacterium]|nr:UPF0262 family protein [Stellaceae bacterium]